MSSEFSGAVWRKSSYSNGQASCVEATNMNNGRTIVAVHDGKAPDASSLTFTAPGWRRFTRSMKANRKPGTSQMRQQYDKIRNIRIAKVPVSA
jgi:hypothetical protein